MSNPVVGEQIIDGRPVGRIIEILPFDYGHRHAIVEFSDRAYFSEKHLDGEPVLWPRPKAAIVIEWEED